MTDKKRFVAAAAGPWSPSDYLNLWEVEELCRIARAEGLPDESDVRIEYDKTFMRTRYVVQHDPSRRKVVQQVDNMTPVEQAIEARGDRLVEIGFQRSSDVRKPLTVRLQVQDDATSIVITSLDLTEHEWALLLAGSVIKVKDTL